MAKDSTIFYQGQVDICRRHLDAEQFGRLMGALFDLAGDGEPEVDDDIALAFEFMALQQNIDRAKYERICERNRLNAKKGGAPKGNQNARKTTQNNRSVEKQPNAKKNNPNDNENDNDNDNDNENESGLNPDGAPSLSSSMVDYLNKKTGSSYRATKSVTERIGNLVADGYAAEDMTRVIDLKVSEWGGSEKMRQYLRPSTLFGEKFEEYVQQPDPPEVEESRRAEKELAALDEKRLVAKEVLGRLEKEVKDIEARGVRDHWDEWQVAADKRDAARAQLESVEKRIDKLRGD